MQPPGATPTSLPAAVATLRHGDHVCWIYDSDDEQHATVGAFIRRGAANGNKVLYLVDRAPEAAARALDPHGDDVRRLLATEQLEVMSTTGSYVEDGRFDPDRMLAVLRDRTESATAAGWRGLWITGEMTWALARVTGAERLAEYEARANQIFPGRASLAVCQYDRRRFDDAALTRVQTAHTRLWARPETQDSLSHGVLRIRSLPDGVALHGELDVSSYSAFARALWRLLEQDGDVVLDMKAVRFCDVASAREMDRFAYELSRTGRRLRIRSAPPLLHRTLGLIGSAAWAIAFDPAPDEG